MIREIIHNPLQLNQPSTQASQADLPIATDLLDTLSAHKDNCVGMAANMIGQQKRIIAVTMRMTNVAMIKPEIIAHSGPYEAKEGCLSLTGQRPAHRFHRITVRFRNLDWQLTTLQLTDWVAEIVQHEIDHCNGILI